MPKELTEASTEQDIIDSLSMDVAPEGNEAADLEDDEAEALESLNASEDTVAEDDDAVEDDEKEDDAEEGENEDDAAEDDEDDSATDDDKAADTAEDVLDVFDDDTFEVVIDGKTVTKTIKEAKEALSLAGATQSRFDEAAKLRTSLEVAQREGFNQLETQRSELTSLVSSLDKLLFVPAVQAADERLRESDPRLYLQQDTLYKQDQLRIHTQRQKLGEHIEQQKQSRAQNLAEYTKAQSALLVQKMPVFNDPEQGKIAMADMLAAAEHYGISKQELAELPPDHRQLIMAYDAYQYRKLLDARELRKGKKIDAGKKKRPARKLSAGRSVRQSTAQVRAKSKSAAMKRAKSTGTVDDIAATM